MKLIHLTDFHLVPPGEVLWGGDPAERVDRVLEDVAAQHGDADLCVITGDLTDRGQPEAYDWLVERLDRFPLETVLMIGNHDDRAVMRERLPGLLDDGNGFVQGERLTSEGTLLFLDTFKGGTSAGQFCARRQAWLKSRLEAADGPVWIFMHHPPMDIGIGYMDRIKLEEAEAFGELIAGHDVRHIFFGHIHRAAYVNWRGIPCTALPGTNHQVPLDNAALGTRYSFEPTMYGVVTISGPDVIVHMDACLDRHQANMG